MNTPRQGGLAQRSPEAKISRKQAKPQSPQSARSTPAEASHHRANHTMAGPIPAPRRATGAAGHPLSAAQRERFAPIVGPAATQAARVQIQAALSLCPPPAQAVIMQVLARLPSPVGAPS